MILRNPGGACRILLLLACAALAWLPAAALAVYEVPIYQPGLTKLQIGIPDFKDLSGGHADLGGQMRDLLADDLMLSGYFQVVDKTSSAGSRCWASGTPASPTSGTRWSTASGTRSC